MLKNFLMKRMIKSQMKNVPADQQAKILSMVEKNPELFQKIAKEVQTEMKSGKNQMAATMEVMKRHQNELKGLM